MYRGFLPRCHVAFESHSRRFKRWLMLTPQKVEQLYGKIFVDYNRSAVVPPPRVSICHRVPRRRRHRRLLPVWPICFCFGCSHEAHQPASCSDVARWNQKNSAESENITWIMANTKKCPKCGVNIEKNQGCNHMTCRKATGVAGTSFAGCALEIGKITVQPLEVTTTATSMKKSRSPMEN